MQEINIRIQEGQKVAFVGASGSGKSTLVRLLLRFYEPTGGKLLVDGKNATDYDLALYRKNMAIVPQEVILFGGTIRENILYGKPDASDEEVIEAAQKANAWEFISTFPETLDTIVGERGVKLSGGQRQRIAIARALILQPDFILLDEPTSALDRSVQAQVVDLLRNLQQSMGLSYIFISHDLRVVKSLSHKILVLKEGKIVEQGTAEQIFNNPQEDYTKELMAAAFD